MGVNATLGMRRSTTCLGHVTQSRYRLPDSAGHQSLSGFGFRRKGMLHAN